ncbi:MAG: four helix bundle protein [Bacteroidales bacterium]|nr:four helix bundle protein [Bacteroidales bacterium]
MRNYRNYEVWKNSVLLSVDIHKVLGAISRQEAYGLFDQMRRASVSIASNIAEGAGRKSPNEFQHFLHISIGSAFELETQLLIALESGYLALETYEKLNDMLITIEKQLN